MLKQSYLFLIVIIFLFLLIHEAVTPQKYGLRINRSASLPYTLFFSKKSSEVSKGMFVTIDHPKDPACSIAKIVVGLPGDIIEVKDSSVFINQCYFGKIKSQSSSGRVYKPISQKVVPDGYVFLHATHEDSFDSRYEEFGLVPMTCIRERLWPIF